jgi:hypothetical protein
MSEFSPTESRSFLNSVTKGDTIIGESTEPDPKHPASEHPIFEGVVVTDRKLSPGDSIPIWRLDENGEPTTGKITNNGNTHQVPVDMLPKRLQGMSRHLKNQGQ